MKSPTKFKQGSLVLPGYDRVRRLLKTRPILLLICLTPGIPEYLSGSSAVNAVVLNPVLFFFQLAANLGLYGSGVILIWEASVRWKKGWATVLLLGAAYGILEEGVALSTLFDPKAGPVGALGTYGHWAGVSWIWAAEIVPFHALFSIALPIALLGMALPETLGKPLISTGRIRIVFATLVADVVILMVVVWRVSGFWMGDSVFFGSLVAIGALVLASRKASMRIPGPRLADNVFSPKVAAIIGVSFFPAVLLTEGFGEASGIPSPIDFVLVISVQAIYLLSVASRVRWGSSLVWLAAGLLVPIMALGLLSQLSLPLVVVVDLLVFLFFRKLAQVTRGPWPGPVTLSRRPNLEITAAKLKDRKN